MSHSGTPLSYVRRFKVLSRDTGLLGAHGAYRQQTAATVGMAFPVDILTTYSHEELERTAESYMAHLLHTNPEKAEYFTLPTRQQTPLSLSCMGFVPLYGADLSHRVLALFTPQDQFTAVALYLAGRWWAVDDILKTTNPSREGLLKVKTLGERVVLYVLNRIVYRAQEMKRNEVPFLCHSGRDYAKILWKDGEAVGFYSVKPKGSMCSNFLTQHYLLPVLDAMFVRKSHRSRGHGLQMLEDYVDSFKDDQLGLKYPLSPAMYNICGRYLSIYPADQGLLWEVEGVGGLFQRCSVASRIHSLALRGESTVGENLMSSGNDMSVEKETTEEILFNQEITEDVLVSENLQVEVGGPAVSTRTRSSELRRKRLREETGEDDAAAAADSVGLMEKVSRMEQSEAEALTPCEALLNMDMIGLGHENAAEAPGQEEQAGGMPILEVEPMNGELMGGMEEESQSSEGAGDLGLVQQSTTQGEDEGKQNPDITVEGTNHEGSVCIHGDSEDAASEDKLLVDLTENQRAKEEDLSSPKEDKTPKLDDKEHQKDLSPEDQSELAYEDQGENEAAEKVPLEDLDPKPGPEEPVGQIPVDLDKNIAMLEVSKEVMEELGESQEVLSEKTKQVLEGVIADEAVNDKRAEEEETNNITEAHVDVPLEQSKEEKNDTAKEEQEVEATKLARKCKGATSTSRSRSKQAAEEELVKTKAEQEDEEEEEKATSTEEEAVEKSSDDEDEPPVVDRRVLRRKVKPIHTPKAKAKRRSKT